MKRLLFVLLCIASSAHAETASSPYRLSWQFPENVMSSIEIDVGDLSTSRFKSDYDLVKYLASMKKVKPRKPREGEAAAPTREVRVDQLDGEGKVRTTLHYVATLEAWRKRLGADMVERLEDEFDAHLRMIFPRGPRSPVAPLDPNEKPPNEKPPNEKPPNEKPPNEKPAAPIVEPPASGDKVKEP